MPRAWQGRVRAPSESPVQRVGARGLETLAPRVLDPARDPSPKPLPCPRFLLVPPSVLVATCGPGRGNLTCLAKPSKVAR
ncbi:hypothetical protein [Polyangium jinanense]|uniref:Uncharacterized protein n=1 Tax=Polyangium jinanense TaxID=2829994 RepID=A0A9X3WZ62_9BACT|nr:hypothetical protein [Polyangium jinanense]MDC3954706.1 hypothetical protein [Polyangium jinanense]MDC3981009.1 hypothetical protein [Polyangium jinanense]